MLQKQHHEEKFISMQAFVDCTPHHQTHGVNTQWTVKDVTDNFLWLACSPQTLVQKSIGYSWRYHRTLWCLFCNSWYSVVAKNVNGDPRCSGFKSHLGYQFIRAEPTEKAASILMFHTILYGQLRMLFQPHHLGSKWGPQQRGFLVNLEFSSLKTFQNLVWFIFWKWCLIQTCFW